MFIQRNNDMLKCIQIYDNKLGKKEKRRQTTIRPVALSRLSLCLPLDNLLPLDLPEHRRRCVERVTTAVIINLVLGGREEYESQRSNTSCTRD